MREKGQERGVRRVCVGERREDLKVVFSNWGERFREDEKRTV